MDIDQLRLENRIDSPKEASHDRATFYGEYRGKPVVIKTGDAYLQKEKAILESLDHQGAPRVLAFLKEKGQYLLITARLPGVPLDEYIQLDRNWQSKQLRIEDILRVINSLAHCFKALRCAGYFYRDLSPAHVIVDKNYVGLVDYEHALSIDQNGHAVADKVIGTWETASPEEFQPDSILTEASNVYSLGVVLLQLATRKMPFFIPAKQAPDAATGRRLTAALHKQLPNIETGNKTLDRVLTKSLQPDQQKRYQTIKEFQSALDPNTKIALN